MRKEKEALEHELRRLRKLTIPELPDLATLDDVVTLSGSYKKQPNGSKYTWSTQLPLRDVFVSIAPHLLESPSDTRVELLLRDFAFAKTQRLGYSKELDDAAFQTVKVQLVAMKLVTVDYLKTTKDSMALFWHLTPLGRRLMFELITIRSSKADKQVE